MDYRLSTKTFEDESENTLFKNSVQTKNTRNISQSPEQKLDNIPIEDCSNFDLDNKDINNVKVIKSKNNLTKNKNKKIRNNKLIHNKTIFNKDKEFIKKFIKEKLKPLAFNYPILLKKKKITNMQTNYSLNSLQVDKIFSPSHNYFKEKQKNKTSKVTNKNLSSFKYIKKRNNNPNIKPQKPKGDNRGQKLSVKSSEIHTNRKNTKNTIIKRPTPVTYLKNPFSETSSKKYDKTKISVFIRKKIEDEDKIRKDKLLILKNKVKLRNSIKNNKEFTQGLFNKTDKKLKYNKTLKDKKSFYSLFFPNYH
jgi:hypothetical protein